MWPGTFEGGQECSKAARNVQRRPGTSKGSQERPKAARKVQRRPGMSAVSAVGSSNRAATRVMRNQDHSE